MSSTVFPFWPYLLFAVIEPFFWFFTWFSFLLKPILHFPSIPASATGFVSYEHYSSFLLHTLAANLYYISSDPGLIREVIYHLALKDILDFAGLFLHQEGNVRTETSWSTVFWTLFLFSNRVLYLRGVFGDNVKNGQTK